MGTPARSLAHLGAVALVRATAVLAGFVATAGVAWGAQDVVLTMTAPAAREQITVEGSISGVVAGAPSAPLRLTLTNPRDVATTVTRVTAGSTGVQAGPAACRRGSYLTVGEWTGSVDVPARGSATVTIPVAVSADLPDACVSATWGLVYAAY